MSDTVITSRFNEGAVQTTRSIEIQARVDAAMQRMAKSFEENEPFLTHKAYEQLLTKQGPIQELRPAHIVVDHQNRLWKAARYQAHRDHLLRCSKIMKVAQRMMGKDRALER